MDLNNNYYCIVITKKQHKQEPTIVAVVHPGNVEVDRDEYMNKRADEVISFVKKQFPEFSNAFFEKKKVSVFV